MKELIDTLFAAKKKYDKDVEQKLNASAQESEIKKLEKRLGKSLPADYKTFLELHDGWKGYFSGVADLLSVEDQDKEWVRSRTKELDGYFEQFNKKGPFAGGAIPIVLGKEERTYLVLDPHNMHFVRYDLAEKQDTYANFTAFLKEELELTNELIGK